MDQRIYLIGYMGVGKSTIARKLAKLLNWEVMDLDQAFETRYKISVSDFFKRYDETLFRKLERSLLRESVDLSQTIISTGGGTACFYDNMEWMNQNGLTVFLKMSAGCLSNRLLNAKKKRPLISGQSKDQLQSFIKKHLQKRAIFYTQARLHFEAESPDIQALAELIKPYLSSAKI
ncbi:MAG: shikimate kinase [Bacteroidales bacterium]|jgi:shikimate kinase|nr:shikimate kinase [Bacteroidales bacterium]MDD4086554.1 shikimate kinase [Bacteroidales bacterium]MDY0086275.1 shikimate kinase [Bacteroidales bacterium]